MIANDINPLDQSYPEGFTILLLVILGLGANMYLFESSRVTKVTLANRESFLHSNMNRLIKQCNKCDNIHNATLFAN